MSAAMRADAVGWAPSLETCEAVSTASVLMRKRLATVRTERGLATRDTFLSVAWEYAAGFRAEVRADLRRRADHAANVHRMIRAGHVTECQATTIRRVVLDVYRAVGLMPPVDYSPR